jgi:uncharacterized membrane protein YfcA
MIGDLARYMIAPPAPVSRREADIRRAERYRGAAFTLVAVFLGVASAMLGIGGPI